jgi:class 3 adenylate cyclase
VGLLDFAYNQLCPGCGSMEYSRDSLDACDRSFHCTICNADREVLLDDRLEVSFSINPAVHALAIDPYRDFESYRRAHFSANYERSPQLVAFLKRSTLAVALLRPEQQQELRAVAKAGEALVLQSPDLHSQAMVRVVEGGAREVALNITERGFEVSELQVAPGATVRLINRRPGPAGAIFAPAWGPAGQAVVQHHPAHWRPFLTGKMLLNNQTFRELFRVQSLAPDLRLNLKSLTVLFTDLKGSTELYDRTGDVYAYQVVQEHFRLLGEAVRRNEGAIVKTMGDAIMATFSTSREAVAAAAEMMRAMEAVNARVKADGHETGLKVGLHEGSALAVNAEARLDYFGQTVNIAARVQALANAGEIWLTEPVLGAEGVEAALRQAGYTSERRVVSLKGVGSPTAVYRCGA